MKIGCSDLTELWPLVRYDTKWCVNVRSKPDVSQINLPHGTKKWKKRKSKNRHVHVRNLAKLSLWPHFLAHHVQQTSLQLTTHCETVQVDGQRVVKSGAGLTDCTMADNGAEAEGDEERRRMSVGGISQLFAACDLNRSGFIEEDELRAICHELSSDELADVFRQLDSDADGKISLQEFADGFQVRAFLVKLSRNYL